jgi:hypothetical protein
MISKDVEQIFRHFASSGIIWGSELLLSKYMIFPFINALSECGVIINGCDLWRFVDPDKNPHNIVSLLGAGFVIDDNDPLADKVENNAKIVKEFIKRKLPEDAELISLIFRDLEIYQFFRSMKE